MRYFKIIFPILLALVAVYYLQETREEGSRETYKVKIQEATPIEVDSQETEEVFPDAGHIEAPATDKARPEEYYPSTSSDDEEEEEETEELEVIDNTPPPPPPEPISDDEEEEESEEDDTIDCCDAKGLKGVTLIDAGLDLRAYEGKMGIHSYVSSVDLSGAKAVLRNFLYQKIDMPLIQQMKNALLDFCKGKGIFAMIMIPEQDVTDGTVILEVLISRVGELTFDGQKYFREQTIRNGVHAKPGEVLDQNKMLNDLAFLNRNPYRQSSMYLSPGEKPGTTNVEILTKDEWPWGFQIGADNTGTQVANRVRLWGTMTCANTFWIGDMLSYQYKTAPDLKEFQSHLLAYQSFLPCQDVFSLFATYGSTEPEIPGLRSTGQSAQGLLRYRKLVKPLYRNFKSYWEFGFDYKWLDSNLFFIGTSTELPLVLQTATINQLMLSYAFSNMTGAHQFTFGMDIFVSPWEGLFPNQMDSDYNKLRPTADVRYMYGKMAAGYRYTYYKDGSMYLLLRGQGATGALLASEQFTLGGIDSVRGYEQSQYLADNAFCSNFEIYSPSFHFFPKKDDQARFVAFCDIGYGTNFNSANPTLANAFLAGVGPGFRYVIAPRWSIRADYGFQLNQIQGSTAMGLFYLVGTLNF